MNLQMECARYEADGTIARYVAGKLAPEDVAAFEDHYLQCERCQRSVRAGSGARDHFAAGATIRGVTRWPWAVGLVAAGIATILVAQTFASNDMRKLGLVEHAPMYLGTPIRGDADAAAALFDSAMIAYNEERYADAQHHFSRIDDPDGRIVVDFYAGVSALMLRRPQEGERSLSAVVAAGASPYYAEALYYRAKAHLQQNDKAAALADLRVAIGIPSPAAQQAAALLKQMEE